MEALSGDVLKINHLISDGIEDVVLLDSAATISADLTEATNKDQKVSLRYANKDGIVDRGGDKDGPGSIKSNPCNDAGGPKGGSQNDRNREYEILPVTTDGTKLTIDLKELEARFKDLLDDKLSMKAFNDTSQADNASKIISYGQNSTKNSELYFSAIAKLCVENMVLRNKLSTILQTTEASTGQPSDSIIVEPLVENKSLKPDTFETLHLVYCGRRRFSYYRDVPRMFQGDLISEHLRGQHGLPKNLTSFLKDNPEIILTANKIYHCGCYGGRSYHGTVRYRDGKLVADSPLAESRCVQIFLGNRIEGVIKNIIKSHPEKFKGYSTVNVRLRYPEPFRFFFNHNKTLLNISTSSHVSESNRSCTQMLCNWFENNHRKDWDESHELISRGKINRKHYTKLFGPDELYVGPTRNNDPDVLLVYKSKEYPCLNFHDRFMDHYYWGCNGRFFKRHYGWQLRWFPNSLVSDEAEVDITSLRFYPLRFAQPGTKEMLIARGHKFWNCRTRSLVCYREFGETPISGQAEKRFMVDYAMLRRMYLNKAIFKNTIDDLGEEALNKTEPPDDDFLVMLPPYIYGFDIDSKAWKLIRIDRTTAVTWNKDAFNRLVIAPDTKEMLLAAITSHGVHNGPATDLIAGKGQGLLILLHGGPGTGKTLTAESIAEAQEKPLYRVTCGDIGMEPEDVEVYLKSVLKIGKAWKCGETLIPNGLVEMNEY
ncbi:hypothetical protein FJTKL_04389 [Diaporthe vaccinii]|uniref:ATPase AAA-type core domain-containing protein n=1 Tax=Diaporthe vaccinii TaxID=105482 RepID=A0ABR4F0Y2_9PEZI